MRIVTNTQKVLLHPKISRKFGFIYNELKTSSKTTLSQSLIFFVRRSILCFTCLFLKNHLCFQLMMIEFINLFAMILIVSSKPYSLRQTNKREMFNEFLILQMTNMLSLFTDYANDREFQYNVGGWIYVGFLGLIIAFNLSFVLFQQFTICRLVFKKYYLRFKHKYGIKDVP